MSEQIQQPTLDGGGAGVIMLPFKRVAKFVHKPATVDITNPPPPHWKEGDIVHEFGGFKVIGPNEDDIKVGVIRVLDAEQCPPDFLALYLNAPSTRRRVEGFGTSPYTVRRDVYSLDVPVITDPARRDKLRAVLESVRQLRELFKRREVLFAELVASLTHEYLVKPTLPRKETKE